MPSSSLALSRVWHSPPDQLVTMGRMVKIVMREYELPRIVELASDLAASAPEKNTVAIAAAIMRWLRAHTRFVTDPIGEQLIKSPSYMVSVIDQKGVIGGDCVDIAMLAASLGMAVGLPARFIAEAYEAAPSVDPDSLTHVYTVLQTSAGWLYLDTQRPPNALAVQPSYRVQVTIP